MKHYCLICGCLMGVVAVAESNREEAASYQHQFIGLSRQNVLTNWDERVISQENERGRLTFTYNAEGDLLYVRLFRKDGGFEGYEYRGGKVRSGLITAFGTKESVLTTFSELEMSDDDVDRVVMRRQADGSFSDERYFTREGTEIHPPKIVKPNILGINCIAAQGSSVMIGPYKWTALGVKDGYPIQRLSRDGKVLIEGSLKLAAKHPWLLGDCAAPIADKLSPELKNAGVKSMHPLRNDVEYLFVIDVRTDEIYYFPRDQKQFIGEKFGLRSEFDKFYYLEGLLFAQDAKEERRKLTAELWPPTDGQSMPVFK